MSGPLIYIYISYLNNVDILAAVTADFVCVFLWQLLFKESTPISMFFLRFPWILRCVQRWVERLLEAHRAAAPICFF